MKDLVGGFIPEEAAVLEAIEQIRIAREKLGECLINLLSEERQGTTKMRGGGEKIADLIGQTATKHKLALPGITVDGMYRDLLLVQRLRPLATEVEALSQTLSDTILEAQSEAWWAATAYYSALARMAPADPQIESEIKPAVDFFARRKKSP